jgi:hypothetical protein
LVASHHSEVPQALFHHPHRRQTVANHRAFINGASERHFSSYCISCSADREEAMLRPHHIHAMFPE